MNCCPVCGNREFLQKQVLWDELAKDWRLSAYEIEYINRQQGMLCKSCGNSLRSMALAAAILDVYGFSETLEKFVESDTAKTLKVLEINEAGGLTSFLKRMPGHRIVRYPEFDMMNLSIKHESYDLIIHSDTLEHVPNPVLGLSECRRVMVKDGRCIFTVPIIVGRMTRSREGLKKSYHGDPLKMPDDYIVHYEFGADIWKLAFEAGFRSVRLHCAEYPSAIAIEAL